MTKLAAIWAQDSNGIIGSGTAMSWHVPADFQHFKASTMGCPIIMGRRSWEALGRALPGRTNIVITRTPGYMAEGALVVSPVEEALDAAREETARTQAPYIWITGGAQLYAQTLPFLDEAVVTDLELDVAASAPEGSAFVYAPPLDPALWRRDENRSDAEWRERSGDARWKVSTWVQR